MTRDTVMKQMSNTLMLTNRCGRVHSIAFDPHRLLQLLLLGTVLLVTVILYSGFRLGADIEARRQLAEVTILQQLSRQQQTEIQDIHALSSASLDALTLRLGNMQAEILRLDVLGDRLVTRADLDASEFNFNILPSIGGPKDDGRPPVTTIADFHAILETLQASIVDRETRLTVLEDVLVSRNLQARILPSGPAVRRGLVTSRFGQRIDPFTGKRGMHKGVDIAGKEGAQILAVADGIVTWSGERKGYGNLVEIDHGTGYVTRYGHNKQQLVEFGDTVHKGQVIALIGTTGRSTGPHVHVEVMKDGRYVNPAKYLAN
jgi:murein DD-endopeptidase MepM/ murein hydrolase activator NlpD